MNPPAVCPMSTRKKEVIPCLAPVAVPARYGQAIAASASEAGLRVRCPRRSGDRPGLDQCVTGKPPLGREAQGRFFVWNASSVGGPTPGRLTQRTRPRETRPGSEGAPSGTAGLSRSACSLGSGSATYTPQPVGAFPGFHLMLQPRAGFWSGSGARPASTASAAFRRSAPVTGSSFPGRLSSNWPRYANRRWES